MAIPIYILVDCCFLMTFSCLILFSLDSAGVNFSCLALGVLS